MTWFVLVLGAFALVVGVFGLISPRSLASYVRFWSGPMRFRLAVVLRLVMGTLLIIAAPACNSPLAIRVLGVLAILAGVTIWFGGRSRLDEVVDWWLSSDARIRCSALFATAIGALLIWAAV